MQTFIDFLSDLSLKEVKVPEFLKIPNWPKMAGKISVSLGKRDYYYVTKSEETGLLRILWNTKKKQEIIFIVEESGTFHVDFLGSYSTFSSGINDRTVLERIRALLIFHQFKEEIYKMITEKLASDLPAHENVAKIVTEALAPFRKK